MSVLGNKDYLVSRKHLTDLCELFPQLYYSGEIVTEVSVLGIKDYLVSRKHLTDLCELFPQLYYSGEIVTEVCVGLGY